MQYVTGITLWGPTNPDRSCPIFVGGVGKGSPAAKAGVRRGDQLLAVDGASITDLQSALGLTSTTAGVVVVQLARDGAAYSVSIQRQESSQVLRESGVKQVDGVQVDLNASDTEIQWVKAEGEDLEGAFAKRDVSVIFPNNHYPLDKKLYYPGFEAFVWDGRKKLTVGGLEDGPAQRSGVRWGDVIVTVNDVDVKGKSDAELEMLLSSLKATPMVLSINRAGMTKTFTFELAQASTVLRDNHWQMLQGRFVPLWALEQYWRCF